MAKLSILAGATSISVNVFIQDSTSTTGAGKSGLVFNTSGLTAYYALPAAASVAITLVTLSAVTSAYSSGGFKEIDATNMPGWYRLDVPNAALASGRFVSIHLQGATGMAPCPVEIALTAVNNQSTGFGLVNASANVVQWNGTNVSSPATAGIPDVNVKNMNNVAATSITTINANIGTTQPTNFTGTAGSALVKSDMTDIAGSAVSTSTAQLGVNVVNIAGQVAALDANNLLKVDTEDWKGGVIPSPNVTGVPKADVIDWLGTAPLALSSQQVQAVVPSTTIVASVTGAVGSVTGNVGGNVVGSVGSVIATVAANLTQILGTALTETSGQIAAAFKKFFNVASPTLTCLGIDQTGDSYARIGIAGVGLTNLGDSRIANLDATVSSRLAPAGTLATVTNLTNAPTAGDFTSTMKTSLNAATPTVTLTSAYDAAKTAAQDGDAMTLTTGERTAVATALLKLDLSTITGEAARSVLNALRFLRNKWTVSGTTLTVTKEDDTTTAWTGTVTTTPGADPITGNDPT